MRAMSGMHDQGGGGRGAGGAPCRGRQWRRGSPRPPRAWPPCRSRRPPRCPARAARPGPSPAARAASVQGSQARLPALPTPRMHGQANPATAVKLGTTWQPRTPTHGSVGSHLPGGRPPPLDAASHWPQLGRAQAGHGPCANPTLALADAQAAHPQHLAHARHRLRQLRRHRRPLALVAGVQFVPARARAHGSPGGAASAIQAPPARVTRTRPSRAGPAPDRWQAALITADTAHRPGPVSEKPAGAETAGPQRAASRMPR